MSGHQRARRSDDWEQAVTWPTHQDAQVRAARRRSLELDRALRRRSRDLERGNAVPTGAAPAGEAPIAGAAPGQSMAPELTGPPEALSA